MPPQRVDGSQPGPGSGGLTVSQEMQRLLDRPGYLKSSQGGQKLRELYVDESANFNARKLNQFAFYCYVGCLPEVKRMVEAGIAPDLTGTETPYKFGYATITISGAQRVELLSRTSGRPVQSETNNPKGTLEYLLSRGTPPDVQDIVGYTALHHATMNANAKIDLARILLENGANVNHQNKYGEVPLFGCFQTNQTASIDLLMEFGASLEIPEADGILPRHFHLRCGPRVSATVDKWVRKRAGEEAALAEKKCNSCGKEGVSLKQCGKCHSARYCSVECQRSHWRTHKKTCKPFTEENTVTLKPFYHAGAQIMSTSDTIRNLMGIPTDPVPPKNKRADRAPSESTFSPSQPKSLIIKVQVPYSPLGSGAPTSTAPLMVYNKKRDFACMIRMGDNPDGYRRVCQVVRDQGIGGAKAYFAAELKSRNELVVKVGEVLATQPF
ncbi:hypothetical protein NLI96_g5628 [Meripilus lineatus]|uniref:MYND-type domain-containing protein n=1 Tax=Meripilus lineatus TaxID=2056292 RepID=A0AAD5V4H5_9APHY|nr:hypothetical protein NLI96_g5628 [Physisporinus lineatus]